MQLILGYLCTLTFCIVTGRSGYVQTARLVSLEALGGQKTKILGVILPLQSGNQCCMNSVLGSKYLDCS